MIKKEIEEIFGGFRWSAQCFALQQLAQKCNPPLSYMAYSTTSQMVHFIIQRQELIAWDNQHKCASGPRGPDDAWRNLLQSFYETNITIFKLLEFLHCWRDISKQGFFRLHFEFHLNRDMYEQEYQSCMRQLRIIKKDDTWNAKVCDSGGGSCRVVQVTDSKGDFVRHFCVCNDKYLYVTEINPYRMYADGSDEFTSRKLQVDDNQNNVDLHRLLRKTIEAYNKVKILDKWQHLIELR